MGPRTKAITPQERLDEVSRRMDQRLDRMKKKKVVGPIFYFRSTHMRREYERVLAETKRPEPVSNSKEEHKKNIGRLLSLAKEKLDWTDIHSPLKGAPKEEFLVRLKVLEEFLRGSLMPQFDAASNIATELGKAADHVSKARTIYNNYKSAHITQPGAYQNLHLEANRHLKDAGANIKIAIKLHKGKI